MKDEWNTLSITYYTVHMQTIAMFYALVMNVSLYNDI